MDVQEINHSLDKRKNNNNNNTWKLILEILTMKIHAFSIVEKFIFFNHNIKVLAVLLNENKNDDNYNHNNS